MPTTVLCDAVPFCFGPVSKMVSIARHLEGRGIRLPFLASGTSIDFANQAGLFDVVLCNSEKDSNLEKEKALFEEADVFVSVMNPESAHFAQKCGVPVVYIDSLFWMWGKVPPHLYDVEKYFIQNFTGIENQLTTVPKNFRYEIVGPIIDDSFPIVETHEDSIVVSLGGMESSLIQVGVNSNYPFVVGGIVADVLSERKEDVYFCGYNKIISRLASSKRYSNIKFGQFEHSHFLSLLAKSKLAITTPGLTTAFEAFFYETPAIFLPPENYSQYLNLNTFRAASSASLSFQWSDFYSEMDIGPCEEEKAGIDKVLKYVRKFEGDKNMQRRFAERLHEMIDDDLSEIKRKQKKFINRMGASSARHIADYILTEFCRGA